MSLNLSRKQLNVLRTLKNLSEEHGYMPSVRELATALDLSPATTQQHINALRKKGFLATDGRAHGIRLVEDAPPPAVPEARPRLVSRPRVVPTAEVGPAGESVRVPIVGRIAAGKPIEAIEVSRDELDLTPALARAGDYLLRVQGDSMIEDGIFDGDLVLIRPQERVEAGQIAVALLEDGNATLKRVYPEKGQVRLQPANRNMEPIFTRHLRIQGRVVGLLRLYS